MCNRTDCAGSWAGPMACAVCKVGPMPENNKNSGLYMKNDILGPGGSTLTDADLARLEDLKAGAPYTNATKEAVTALVAEVRRLRAELEQTQHGMEAAYMSGRADGREAIR